MDSYYNIYFVKDGEHKLIGKRKNGIEAFAFAAEHCKNLIKFKDVVFSRNVDGFTVGYGVMGEYYSAVKEWV